MKFILGKMPENPDFNPENEGWTPLREPGPIRVQLLSLPLVVFIAILMQLGFWFAGIDVSPLSKLRNIPIALVLILGIIPVHEVLHLLCFPNLGLNKETFIGFWPKMFVPYVYYDDALPRNRFILISACPFIIISIIPLLGSMFTHDLHPLIVAVSYLNGLFCGVDLMGVCLLIRQVPSDAQVRNVGYRGYWKKKSSTPPGPGPG